ncbi:sulfotransferase domain-containing protein [Actinoplanes sp. CA-252034]|uniref:sulfotransferase domain-containing protein n=1 Tax=Actinoplanes sp. CA-252034 TaxID=3239906 RepID=UPI003D9955B1
MAPTFVISTGRCGSTLVSRMLREHPSVLSVSELFSTVRGRDCFDGILDGAEFWRMLSAPDRAVDVMVEAGLGVSELVYPYATGRFGTADGIPAICHMTLPMLTDDPDALHDELAAELPTWPARPIADQYRAFFAHLAARFDRPVMVERSGGSLSMVPALRRLFPEARFVYLARNGPDSARSMSRHAGFWLMLLAREAARIAGVASPDQLGPDHFRLLPATLNRLLTTPDALPEVMRQDVPVTAFGALWSTMATEGAGELLRLPSERWMMTTYEDLTATPEAELTRLAAFLGVDAAPQWLGNAAGLVEQPRHDDHPDPRLLAALRRACAPGTAADVALARAAA